MKTVKFISILLIGLFIISSCSKETLTGAGELAPTPAKQLTLADIKVTAQDGTLKFETSDDFLKALDILDTIPMETRVAWEQNLGFNSIRAEYDKALDAFDYDPNFNAADYKEYISLDEGLPVITNHIPYFASALNKEGMVIVNGSLGTVRRDGCFWSVEHNTRSLNKLIVSKKMNADLGLYAFEAPESMQGKVCSGGARDSRWSDFQRVDNGNNRGSSRLSGNIDYHYYVSPPFNNYTEVNIKVSMRMQGISERKGRRRWSRHRVNHTFNWDFRVDHNEVNLNGDIQSTTPIFASGTETHNNNQVAVKEIIIKNEKRLFTYPAFNHFVLNRVNTGTLNGGTSQTTHHLSPVFISYGCN